MGSNQSSRIAVGIAVAPMIESKQPVDEWRWLDNLSRAWPTFDGCAIPRSLPGWCAATTSSSEKRKQKLAFS